MTDVELGASAAEHLPPAFPQRAAWGTASRLRTWQQSALASYFEYPRKDFLVAATPGAGKTTFALRLATELIDRGEVSRLVVVAPTEHLKYQWADAAARIGLDLDPNFRNADREMGSHFRGIVVTYAQIAKNPLVHQRLVEQRPTLAILDEIHHGGDALSWGDGIRIAFDQAKRRLELTGTPFRSDDAPIPFVRYSADAEGNQTSRADFSYGYADALRDGVVRPVLFMAYSGNMQWQDKSGEVLSAELANPATKDVLAAAWRTALDPEGDWIAAVLRAADHRLLELRHTIPDAGGLLVATDQTQARAYAKVLAEVSGEYPTLVLSDDPSAGDQIKQYAQSTSKWLIAVRMVSEGVDVPRLSVGVYATSASTALFFAQLIGRFVRARKRGETATIFVPSVRPLLELASDLERERDHVLGHGKNRDDLPATQLSDDLKPKQGEEDPFDLPGEYQALGATATFDKVLFEGGEWGQEAEVGSLEEQEYLGLPGLLEPDQVKAVLAHRQEKIQHSRKHQSKQPAQVPMHEQLTKKRRELSRLVSIWAAVSGQPHGKIHSALRRQTGGPAVAQADVAHLDARIKLIRRWLGKTTNA